MVNNSATFLERRELVNIGGAEIMFMVNAESVTATPGAQSAKEVVFASITATPANLRLQIHLGILKGHSPKYNLDGNNGLPSSR